MITFSFNPFKKSVLPVIAAVLNTLVVSWNDAAEIQLLVPRDARVIPCNIGVEVADKPSRYSTNFLSFLLKIEFSSLI